MDGIMKGQLGMQNLLQIFIAVICFIYIVYPVTLPMINDYVLVLQANPQPYTSVLIAIIQLWPVVIGIGVLALIWFFVVPHQEQRLY